MPEGRARPGPTGPEHVEGHSHVATESRDWRTELRARGYRLTPQRELILSAIDELRHATPDEVLAHVQARASSVNVSTVYRTLEVLEEIGLVRHTHLSDRAPTYHSVTRREHFHLKCRSCHRVTSVDVDVLSPLRDVLEAQYGFTLDAGHVTLFGACCEPCD